MQSHQFLLRHREGQFIRDWCREKIRFPRVTIGPDDGWKLRVTRPRTLRLALIPAAATRWGKRCAAALPRHTLRSRFERTPAPPPAGDRAAVSPRLRKKARGGGAQIGQHQPAIAAVSRLSQSARRGARQPAQPASAAGDVTNSRPAGKIRLAAGGDRAGLQFHGAFEGAVAAADTRIAKASRDEPVCNLAWAPWAAGWSAC